MRFASRGRKERTHTEGWQCLCAAGDPAPYRPSRQEELRLEEKLAKTTQHKSNDNLALHAHFRLCTEQVEVSNKLINN